MVSKEVTSYKTLMEKRVHTLPYDLEPEQEGSAAGVPREDRLLGIARLLWDERRFLGKSALWVGAIILVLGLFMRNTYRSTVQLMPPDDQSGSKAGLAMMASMAGKMAGGASG